MSTPVATLFILNARRDLDVKNPDDGTSFFSIDMAVVILI
jgi:hypothetical protein